ncbi:glycosyltransferase family 2 protein [Candidatus Daviesbacteria bacterium]|nr:glycosyltransferase family 2 protein [Candidatus Daviesbacteria bacterium]
MKNLPSITVITGVLDSHIPTFKQVLDSLKLQKYPKKLIQHIVMDGGSTNKSPELARRYGCLVIVRKDLKDKDEARVGIAIKKAKGDLILMLQSDNILTSSDWLLKMVKPFIEDGKVFCTFSAYNSYHKDMPATTRYCALFGSPDPTLYYLNKTEKIRMDKTQYNKGKVIKKTQDYYIVQFNQDNLPTLGDNGHLFLTSVMKRVVKDYETYMHTDAFSELLDLGYNTFGVVNNSIIHTQKANIIDLIKRRIEAKEQFYDQNRGKRKYLVFNWNSYQDRINLTKYIIFSFTFIIPFIESVRGYARIRDRAWFLHPLICFGMVIAYAISEIKWLLKKLSF